MKKLILWGLVTLFTIGVYAQNDTIIRNNGRDSSNIDRERKMENFNGSQVIDKGIKQNDHPDGVMMIDKKVMVVMSGKMAPLEKDIVLNNGTRIRNDGTITKKDGSKKMLKNGEHIGMNGKMIDMKSMPMNKKQEYSK